MDSELAPKREKADAGGPPGPLAPGLRPLEQNALSERQRLDAEALSLVMRACGHPFAYACYKK